MSKHLRLDGVDPVHKCACTHAISESWWMEGYDLCRRCSEKHSETNAERQRRRERKERRQQEQQDGGDDMTAGPKLSAERLARMLALHGEGLTPFQIATRMNTGSKTVTRHLEAQGLTPNVLQVNGPVKVKHVDPATLRDKPARKTRRKFTPLTKPPHQPAGAAAEGAERPKGLGDASTVAADPAAAAPPTAAPPAPCPVSAPEVGDENQTPETDPTGQASSPATDYCRDFEGACTVGDRCLDPDTQILCWRECGSFKPASGEATQQDGFCAKLRVHLLINEPCPDGRGIPCGPLCPVWRKEDPLTETPTEASAGTPAATEEEREPGTGWAPCESVVSQAIAASDDVAAGPANPCEMQDPEPAPARPVGWCERFSSPRIQGAWCVDLHGEVCGSGCTSWKLDGPEACHPTPEAFEPEIPTPDQLIYHSEVYLPPPRKVSAPEMIRDVFPNTDLVTASLMDAVDLLPLGVTREGVKRAIYELARLRGVVELLVPRIRL